VELKDEHLPRFRGAEAFYFGIYKALSCAINRDTAEFFQQISIALFLVNLLAFGSILTKTVRSDLIIRERIILLAD